MTRGTLAWRLYALGVVQLALVTFAAILVAIHEAPSGPPPDPERQAEVAAALLSPLLSQPSELLRELEELEGRGMSGSVYDADGELLATSVRPPLPRMEPHPFERRRHPHGPPPEGPPPFGPPPADWGGPPDRALAVFVGEAAAPRRAVLVARFTLPRRDLRGPLFTLGLGLLIVGVGAVLMSRWIVRPLEHLSRAARALGEGDLQARSGLSRRDEVGDVSRTFDEMAERVERLVRAEKELLANVSHELRTPLARIRVALDLAVEGDARAAREALAEIEVDLAELETLLEDVLAAARMEMQGGRATPAAFALRLEEVVPATLVESSAARFRSRHPDRELVVTVGGALPLVCVDRMLVRRTVDNLLENADKYSPNPDSPVWLRASANDGLLVIEVEDQGMGIPAEDVPDVFIPFFRGERSRSRGAGGVGLGLTLAKRIVEAHGGFIHVESAVSLGTTIRVELPAGGETIRKTCDTGP
jgi:signal transduction histidine kinase